jgi:hypothetical protein
MTREMYGYAVNAVNAKIEVSVCSDYEECRLQGYDAVWPGINLLTCRGKYYIRTIHPKIQEILTGCTTSRRIRF